MRTAEVWAGDRAGNIEFTLVEERATLVWLAQLAALELHPSLSLAADIDFVVCDDLPTLVWLANLADLELHPSLAHVHAPAAPAILAFDLDPGPPATIVECCRVALLLRDLFGSLGMECYPKSSGSKGMQVYVPLNGEVTYERTKPYARAVAQALERSEPDLVLSRMTKSLREGKVFVDWSQNTSSKTTVAAYSLRAREHPTVSTPITWDEVSDALDAGDPDCLRFEASDVLERVERHGDLFAPVLELEQELPE